MKNSGLACWISSTRSRTGPIFSAARSASPRIWNSTRAACPSVAIWPALAGSSGERTCCTASRPEMPATTSSIAARKAGSLASSVVALDQDALAGGLLEPGVEDRVHPAGLAGPGRVGVDALRSDGAADREGDDDEREPAERGGLPVAGAPAAHAGREVALGVVGAGHAVAPSVGEHLPTTLGARLRAVVVPRPDSVSDPPTISVSDLGRRRPPRATGTLEAWHGSARWCAGSASTR